MAELLAAAVAAAARGWHVFPVLPDSKRPAIAGWPTRALADPRAVAEGWPASHNVGIACGPSQLVVVDLDTPKDELLPAPWDTAEGVRDGGDVFACLLADHGQTWPATYTVGTPRGGWHLYFKWDQPSRTIRNSAGKLGPLIDIRGDGGYVLAGGSVVDGRPYRVLDPAAPVAPLPPWLAVALGDPPPPQRRITVPTRRVGSADKYTAAAVQAELFAVATASNGTRNDQLNRSAYALARFVTAGRLDPTDVADALLAAARTAGLDDREATRTIQSAFTARCA